MSAMAMLQQQLRNASGWLLGPRNRCANRDAPPYWAKHAPMTRAPVEVRNWQDLESSSNRV